MDIKNKFNPHNSDSEFAYLDSITGPNSFYGDDQMNFVTDLFESCQEFVPDTASDPFLEELGLGFENQFERVTFTSHSAGLSNSNTRGLRVVGIDSDSDTEEIDAIFKVDENGTDPECNSGLPILGDFSLLDDKGAGGEDSNWEEVDEREQFCSVIGRIEEISVSSGTCSEDEDDIVEESERNLEWEVLLAVMNRNLELGNVGDDISYLAVEDDYIYDAEYDSLFGQIVESATSLKISPPAAKSVVENLPSVVLTEEDLKGNNVLCAVCRDEIVMEEKVASLPCCHHYHGDCIVRWLRARNTCPICRFELPTDDDNYEG
ncbi:hypothetical protein LguiA_006241 [Lonicera macranthoides]